MDSLVPPASRLATMPSASCFLLQDRPQRDRLAVPPHQDLDGLPDPMPGKLLVKREPDAEDYGYRGLRREPGGPPQYPRTER